MEAEAGVGSVLLLEELLAQHVVVGDGGLVCLGPDVVLVGQGQAGGQEGGEEEPGHHLVCLPAGEGRECGGREGWPPGGQGGRGKGETFRVENTELVRSVKPGRFGVLHFFSVALYVSFCSIIFNIPYEAILTHFNKR